MMKRVFSLMLAVCLSLCAVLCAAEGDEKTIACEGITGPYQWLNYELTVDSIRVAPGGELFTGATLGSRFVKEDNRIVSQIKETRVEIRLLGGDDGVAYEDLIQDNIAQFVLRDASGEEIPLYCWSWWGVGFDPEKGFGSFDVQEGFLLFYFLPEGVNAEDLTLTVENTPA